MDEFILIVQSLFIAVITALLFAAETAEAAGPDSINVVLNVFSLFILIAGVLAAPRYLRSKNIERQLAEKDVAIATKEQSIVALRERIATQEMQLDSAFARCKDLEERNLKYQNISEELQRRYEEQARYTAREALEALKQLVARSDAEAERRHNEIVMVVQSMSPNTDRREGDQEE